MAWSVLGGSLQTATMGALGRIEGDAAHDAGSAEHRRAKCALALRSRRVVARYEVHHLLEVGQVGRVVVNQTASISDIDQSKPMCCGAMQW